MTDKELSIQYHSIRFYDGKSTTENVRYRIGNNVETIEDKVELYYDTWESFHLIPASRPTVQIPSAVTKLVTIPGKSIPFDFSTYLTGHPVFSNRNGAWQFIVDIDYVNEQYGGWLEFDYEMRQIFHGRVFKVVLVDDPNYFYAGEINYGGFQPGKAFSTISLSYNFYPYKKSLVSSLDLWKWDDFDFQDGVIMYLKDLAIDKTRIVNMYGSRERISPYITASENITLEKYENSEWKSYGVVPTTPISNTKSIIPGFVIDYGLNKLRFKGTGTVTIDYRRGLL